MGVDTRRPPLPAPTETTSVLNSDNDAFISDDVATNLTTRTDKTSYSIPEDGTPVTVSTRKITGDSDGLHRRNKSQTSLLIEYFEVGKSGDKVQSRPSVRVRVTPSSRSKNKTGVSDHIEITQTGKNRKPSYTRRISIPSKLQNPDGTEISEISYSDASNLSSRPPVEVEVLQNYSDLSQSSAGRYVPPTSDISSMPPSSMLDTAPVFKAPGRQRSRSVTREKDTLKAPTRRRSRSLSRERITQKVMEKLANDPDMAVSKKKSRSRQSSVSSLPSDVKSSRRRSSRSQKDDDYSSTGVESSLISNTKRRSGDATSIRSGTSAVSINNPKLLQTVEDAIRRLILPEINALKEEQQTQKNKDKFEHIRHASITSVESHDRDHLRRRVSKSSSVPNIKPKITVRGEDESRERIISGDSVRSKKSHRSTRDSPSEKGSSRRSSRHSLSREEETLKKKSSRSSEKSSHRTRDAAIAGALGAGLTAAALKHHDSEQSLSSNRERRERRKKRSKSHSRSQSRAESVSELTETTQDTVSGLEKHQIPPMPMQSYMQSSELTRDSILSAETSAESRVSVGRATPLQEVRRGSPFKVLSPGPRTPTRTPVALQRGLGTHFSNRSKGDISIPSTKSDRSIRTKARAAGLAAAGLGGVAGATALAHSHHEEEEEEHVSHHEYGTQGTPTREVSPVQSLASYEAGDDNLDVAPQDSARSMRSVQSLHSAQSAHSLGSSAASRKISALSMGSAESSPTNRSKMRPESLIHDPIGDSDLAHTEGTPRTLDVDDFFDRNHEENERYRQEVEETPDYTNKHLSTFTQDSLDVPGSDKVAAAQDIRGVGANPEYVHTPLAVESAVASLHDPSNLSVRSSQSSPIKKGMDTYQQDYHNERGIAEGYPRSPAQETISTQREDSPSKDRWAAIRAQAQQLDEQVHSDREIPNSPQQSIAHSDQSEPIKMTANAIPVGDDPMPEFVYHDDESEITTNPSSIRGPGMGPGVGASAYGPTHTSHWPYEPTPPMSSGNLPGGQGSQYERDGHAGAAALAGVGATAVGIAAAAAYKASQDKGKQRISEQEYPYEPSEEDYETGIQRGLDTVDQGYNRQQDYSELKAGTPQSPAGIWKGDEGYISAAQGVQTPEPYGSKMFDDDGDLDDPFTTKQMRHMSGNSHGMSSPLYDSATGRGIDRIQSKDIVALMDHLTVRDAQRNARDTEILVTLVRSAAEMRNQFEEIKKFIAEQDRMIMSNTDRDAEATIQRVLNGPRPQPLGSPRVPPGATRRGSKEDVEDIQTRRKNVFKRALKGLSMRSSNDLTKIEDMLMQLLGEVEGLKDSTAFQRAPTTANTNSHSNSLNSYDNLRATNEQSSGYEPEGQAGTSSTPNQSGYLSNPSTSRNINPMGMPPMPMPMPPMPMPMHSGYDGRRGSGGQRISTVLERDEELEDHEANLLDNGFENTERLLTPTQEARPRNVAYETPPQPQAEYTSPQNQDNTPKRKHKSNNSSLSWVPKISRWSKTTASTNPETPRFSGNQKDGRPYSVESRSGSRVNMPYYDDYQLDEEDRLRSNVSLSRDQPRSPSPLIPENEYDDPKIQVHRNSLNLQHPQPRPGPTHRHQSHLETQAHTFTSGPMSPGDSELDQWGATPSLALNRNRYSGQSQQSAPDSQSPISSDGGYSVHSASEQALSPAGPARPPKIREDNGPLVPPSTQGNLNKPMYSSPLSSGYLAAPLAPIEEVRYSLETDSGRDHRLTPSPGPSSGPRAMMQSGQRKITGPRPMGSRSPSIKGMETSGTVRRKAPSERTESPLSYRTSLDSETF